jgi:hypothetical protein
VTKVRKIAIARDKAAPEDIPEVIYDKPDPHANP